MTQDPSSPFKIKSHFERGLLPPDPHLACTDHPANNCSEWTAELAMRKADSNYGRVSENPPDGASEVLSVSPAEGSGSREKGQNSLSQGRPCRVWDRMKRGSRCIVYS